MQQPFFDGNPGSDPTYEALRAPDDPNSSHAREHFDPLWSDAAPFLSAELRENARAQFQQVFWEVYLAATLRKLGKDLVPRAERGLHSEGPDLFQRDPEVFYEAVAVMPGTTADTVLKATPGLAREVPDVAISLRLTSGLSKKREGYGRYLETGVVPPDVPYVIALNAGAVPSATKEQALPRIVRSVFPIGHEVLQLDSRTWHCVGTSYTYRSELPRRSGPPVPTCFFEDNLACGISAILYSCVNAFNWPSSPGGDFLLVHNPRSINPLPRGFLAGARDFWLEGDRLRGEIAGVGAG